MKCTDLCTGDKPLCGFFGDKWTWYRMTFTSVPFLSIHVPPRNLGSLRPIFSTTSLNPFSFESAMASQEMIMDYLTHRKQKRAFCALSITAKNSLISRGLTFWSKRLCTMYVNSIFMYVFAIEIKFCRGRIRRQTQFTVNKLSGLIIAHKVEYLNMAHCNTSKSKKFERFLCILRHVQQI